MVVQPAQNGNGKDVTMRLHSARMRRSFAEGSATTHYALSRSCLVHRLSSVHDKPI